MITSSWASFEFMNNLPLPLPFLFTAHSLAPIPPLCLRLSLPSFPYHPDGVTDALQLWVFQTLHEFVPDDLVVFFQLHQPREGTPVYVPVGHGGQSGDEGTTTDRGCTQQRHFFAPGKFGKLKRNKRRGNLLKNKENSRDGGCGRGGSFEVAFHITSLKTSAEHFFSFSHLYVLTIPFSPPVPALPAMYEVACCSPLPGWFTSCTPSARVKRRESTTLSTVLRPRVIRRQRTHSWHIHTAVTPTHTQLAHPHSCHTHTHTAVTPTQLSHPHTHSWRIHTHSWYIHTAVTYTHTAGNTQTITHTQLCVPTE